jgi:hypothetical protein
MRLFRRASAAATAPAPAVASIDVATISHRFNWEWAMDPDNGASEDTYWWWARSIRVDPNEVIADDGEGNLWSVPFITDGEDAVTFGEPIRVRETYVPVAAADGATATAVVQRRRQRVAAAALDQPAKPDPTTATAATTPEEEAQSDMTDEQRRALALSLGLSEDASETDIHEAAAARAQADPPDEPETPVEQPEAEVETTEVETPEPVAASLRTVLGLPGTATEAQIRERVAELDAGARAGAEARATQLRSERDQLVDAAVRDGRIAPSVRDAWRQALDARPDEEAAALAALPTDRIPVSERGSTPQTDQTNPGSLGRALAASGLTGREEKS